MRFMMFMIPDIYQGDEGKNLQPDFAPSAEAVAAMMAYNEELAKAGALISLDGLRPLSMGARVRFTGGKAVVTDGPYVEAKEVVGGYWMIRADSREQAIEWAKRCPAKDDCMIEVRQVFEMDEMPPDVQEAARRATI